ncbi:hypothetical protein [Peredibacter starrii]|uniref:Flagellar protein FliT n=1 Tax=Peredibacter starrii TaxID=28202 RepID=A0AAX4HR28_9BACT|nr:hypothetical protein [Peredibacter starrii]WPU65505.1 hypothetical protein SOO65_01970 [Peredibacter starrii]
MDKLTLLFEEFIMKAITMTEAILECDFSQGTQLDSFTENRERLLQIIEKISVQIDWNEVTDEKRADLNRQIEYIKKLDEKLLVKLQEYQATLKLEIDQTSRSRENIKGYNLNDVK